MKIIDAHKGCYEYTTYFKGLAGHSSAPHKGVSAVEYASRYVNKLIELREKLKERAPKDSIFDPPHSTLSEKTHQYYLLLDLPWLFLCA